MHREYRVDSLMWDTFDQEMIMNGDERLAVTEILEQLMMKYENQYDRLQDKMEREVIHMDFFEALYEILYDFTYDDFTLLARVEKLFEEKSTAFCNKKMQNRHN